ncbi:MAG: hypothetical protein ACXVJ4_05170 [Acidimicrobiia bacterium]
MLVVVLTPVVVAAFGLAMLSLIGALTGWSPPVLKQTTSIDSLYTGDGFTKPRVVMLVVGLTVGYIAAAAMRWGIHRRDRHPGARPMTRTPA